MTEAVCDINRPDIQQLDDDNMITWEPGDLVVTTGCRVQRLGPERVTSLAQQQAVFADYLVAVPYGDDDINVGDIVRVTTSLDDMLIGRRLRVSHVMVGSLVWERDLYCTDDMAGG